MTPERIAELRILADAPGDRIACADALDEALDAIEDAADVIKNAERLLREGVKYSAALRRVLAFCKEQVDRGDLPPGQREVWNNALAHVLAIASEGL